MTHDAGAQAYGSDTLDVEHLLGTFVAADDPDRHLLEPWAASIHGPILDVGSGTGRWTGHLAQLGHDIAGLEPAARLVAHARTAHPGVTFHHGAIAELAEMSARWRGILAWYSIIHLGPDHLPQALAQLRSALEDDGSLLMSFFSGPSQLAFPHPAATAFRWPMDDMIAMLEVAGFTVVTHHWAAPAPHAHLVAIATSGAGQPTGK